VGTEESHMDSVTKRQLLDNIRDDPDDLSARLVFADFIQETNPDQERRAIWIRECTKKEVRDDSDRVLAHEIAAMYGVPSRSTYYLDIPADHPDTAWTGGEEKGKDGHWRCSVSYRGALLTVRLGLVEEVHLPPGLRGLAELRDALDGHPVHKACRYTSMLFPYGVICTKKFIEHMGDSWPFGDCVLNTAIGMSTHVDQALVRDFCPVADELFPYAWDLFDDGLGYSREPYTADMNGYCYFPNLKFTGTADEAFDAALLNFIQRRPLTKGEQG